MGKKPSTKNVRRPKGHVSSLATNFIHLRNPWVTVWWSAAFPGFGQIILGSYIKGFLLVVWEFVMNIQTNVNVAIIYSFTGQFDLAREALDARWILLYQGTFVYAAWDSYRSTVDLNKFSILTDREGFNMTPFKINSVEINYFDKRNPWVALAWSVLMPGAGHLYTHRLPTGFFVLALWIVIIYFSRLFEAVLFYSVGDFSLATAVLDPEWLMFLPSLYGFAIYDSYTNTVEYNKLFEMEQARYLKVNYQDPEYDMPL